MNKNLVPYLAAGGGLVGALLLFLLRTNQPTGTPAPAIQPHLRETSPAAEDAGSVNTSETWPAVPAVNSSFASAIIDLLPASVPSQNSNAATMPPTRTTISDSTERVTKFPAAAMRLAPEPAAAVANHDPAANQRVQMPLALFPPPPSVTLSEDQVSALANLRQQFSDAVGGPNQDPADPGYRERWQRAQPTLDEQFWTLFGQDAYMLHVNEAFRQAENAAP